METSQLKFSERLGLVFIVQSASLSIISVSVILGYAIYHTLRNISRPPVTRKVTLLRNSLDYFFLSLLFWDFIMALGSMMNILWVRQAEITIGSYCTTQAIFKNIGTLGVALTTAAIAIYTFLVIFMRWQLTSSRWLPLTVIGLISLFLFLVPLVGTRIHTNPPFYGKSTYWCWIRREHYSERLGLEYGLAWLTALISIVLYVPLFFALRGNIQIDLQQADPSSRGKVSLSWRRVRRGDQQNQTRTERRESLDIAKQMLAYPIAYVILVLPMSLVRWIESPEKPLPPVYTALAGIIWSSSGLVNVLLYAFTRPYLLPSWRPCRRRISHSRRGQLDATRSSETHLEDGRTDGLPGMNILSNISAMGGNSFGQRSAVPPRKIPGAPMLSDDETDDEDPPLPQSGAPIPITPAAAFRNLHTQSNTSAIKTPTYQECCASEEATVTLATEGKPDPAALGSNDHD